MFVTCIFEHKRYCNAVEQQHDVPASYVPQKRKRELMYRNTTVRVHSPPPPFPPTHSAGAHPLQVKEHLFSGGVADPQGRQEVREGGGAGLGEGATRTFEGSLGSTRLHTPKAQTCH